MKKRFLCALLTLLMLVSLVPATAFNASAASYSTSESAITILKQMEGYQRTCQNGYIGYGTRCEKCVENKTHDCEEEISEKQADTALRAALKDLDSAINSFASKNGLSLSQSKHDALVLFSFENGTAWTTGTGDFKSAVVSGETGSDFLDAICRWEISVDDDNRRMVEANMYLNGVYSSTRPYNFIRISYNASKSPEYAGMNGSLNGNASLQYYDTTEDPVPEITPSLSGHKFLGWYLRNTYGYLELVTEIHSSYHTHELIARWQPNNAIDGNNNTEVYYEVDAEDLASEYAYSYPNGMEQRITLSGTIVADRDFIDEDGNRWLRIKSGNPLVNNWVILGEYGSYDHPAMEDDDVIALAVVTYNGYVNVRENAGTNYKIVGSIPKGTEVKIYEIKVVNGHEWGRCDRGWFCLTYADVTRLSDESDTTEVEGMLAYAFTGTLENLMIYLAPRQDAEMYRIRTYFDPEITVTHLKADDDGTTWGKIPEGWVRVSDAAGNPLDVRLDIAKYVVISDGVTVRTAPYTSAARQDSLSKGVEFFVNGNKQIVVAGATIWGWADKAGEFSSENNNESWGTDGESRPGTNPGVSGATYGGWVNLDQNHVSRNGAPVVENANPLAGMMATVIGTDNVNVRAYTDATYAKVGSLSRGTTVHVWDEEDGWYKIDHNQNGEEEYEDGWVSGQYLNLFQSSSSGSSSGTGSTGSGNGTVETGLGIVANTYTGVNVRTGAGTGYAAVGKILAGTTVEIQEVKNVGTAKWGRVPQGWVCMDYVTMVSHYPVAGSGSNSGSASNGGSSNSTTSTEAAVYTGFTKREVTVYKTTTSTWDGSTMKINAESVRTLPQGSPVTIHELLAVEVVNEEIIDGETNHGDINATVTVRGYWARVNDGYIFSPGQNIELNPLDEDTYTVTTVDSKTGYLVVYETAGGAVKDSDDLEKYDTVSVTTMKIVDGTVWCRVEYTNNDGYIRDGYVKIKELTRGVVSAPVQNNNNNNTNTNTGNTGAGNLILGSSGNTANQGTNGFVNNAGGYRYTGKVIRTGSVNVRALPSQTAQLTTTLKGGAALVIYETTISEGMAWGRCDAGWVYLYYVDLQPCNTAVDAKVVYNENTIAYTDANCSGVAGTYARMSVVDIYEVVGSMCRTDLGWVHVDNLG